VEIPRRLGWVWRTRPEALPGGLDAMLVRAANGATTGGSGGIDYADNYRAWKQRLGDRVLPWTWLGPPASSDGLAAAELVAEAAPGEPLYVVCIEQGVQDAEAEAFAERLRQLAPDALLGFSSYPTRGQAASFGVPWDACVAVFDLGLPQVYFASQRAELARVVADHRGRPVHVAVSPSEDAGWLHAASAALDGHLGVSIWRHGLDQFASWAHELRGDAAPPAASRAGRGMTAGVGATADGSAAREVRAVGAAPARAVAVRAEQATGATTPPPAAPAPAPPGTPVPLPAPPTPAANGRGGRNGRGEEAGDRAGRTGRATRPASSSTAAGDGATAAQDQQAGDEFDMATIADLENALRKVLNEGAGPGQPSWAASSATAYQASQVVPERLGQANSVARATREAMEALQLTLTERIGTVIGIVQATKEAVDGLHLDLPDQQVQAIADAVAAKLLGGPTGTLTEDEVQAIADAVAGRLLDIPLGMVELDDQSITRVGDLVADRVAGRLGQSVIGALRDQFSKE
jgi:hypothetical protein